MTLSAIPTSTEGGPFNYLAGRGPTLTVDDLRTAVQGDHGLNLMQKQHLLNLLNNPNVEERLLAGAAGAALSYALARYMGMSGTSRLLMSLAGFGAGNILLGALTPEPKHTRWNPERATNHIIL